ncbi:hypothetical protein [Pelagicoccus mobilis]|uniref:Uncharacterized protein n=1 Tax=Pelagicoccus mobilis TaxID=415221 RepID=A0A934S0A0_9BACT|nr:hypothetical protein [Pelagicoccus mobilis]MBK1878624.1 hypothetical protein [Pelagicoccus mobilis]
MLLSLLFLIILAVLAYQTKKVVLPAIVFGVLKAISSCFFIVAESELSYDTIGLLAGSQLLANGLLGTAIAYLVVKHSQDWKFAILTTVLAIVTFMTSAIDPIIAA